MENSKVNSKMVGKLVKALPLFLIFLIFASTVFAQTGFSVNTEIQNSRITPTDYAQYTVTINNYDLDNRIFSLSLGAAYAPNWIISPSSVEVLGGQEKNITVKVYPKSTTALGSYLLGLKVSDDVDSTKISLPILLTLDAYVSGYPPSVALNVQVPSVQDPREKMKVSVLLRNRNQLDIKNLIVQLSSDIFSKQYNLSLAPRVEKTNELVFDIPPLQAPGDYNLNVKVTYPQTGRIIAESDSAFTISQYSSINPEFFSKTSWFLTTDTIVMQNNGNYERTKEVAVPANWLERMFISTNLPATLEKVNGQTQLKWVVSLKPTETKQILIEKNYRVLAIIVLLLILALIGYFIFRSPIVILKEAAVVNKDEEGISEIKVRLFLKNRSRKAVHNITVTDKLLRITELADTHSMGSLRPSKVSKTSKKGTLLYWDLDSLESYEERIITYRINSKLKIVGAVNLPRSRVKFDTGRGKERIKMSSATIFIQ